MTAHSIPWEPGKAFDQIAFSIASLGANTFLCKALVYEDDQMYPGALLASAASIASDIGTGVRTAAISGTGTKSRLWLALLGHGSGAVPNFAGIASGMRDMSLTSPTLLFSQNNPGFSASGFSAGTPPNPWPSAPNSVTAVYKLALRAA